MPMNHTEAQITWSAASSITLNNATQTDSDAHTLGDSCIGYSIQVHVDNQGAPAAGDTLKIYLKKTAGDILGDTGDDFDTDQHAEYVGTLDTVAANTPGEDPARRTYDFIKGGVKSIKLSVVAPQAATRNIVVRARIIEQRAE